MEMKNEDHISLLLKWEDTGLSQFYDLQCKVGLVLDLERHPKNNQADGEDKLRRSLALLRVVQPGKMRG